MSYVFNKHEFCNVLIICLVTFGEFILQCSRPEAPRPLKKNFIDDNFINAKALKYHNRA